MNLRSAVVLLLASNACDDTLFPSGHHAGPTSGATGWCAVRSMISSSCLGCHSAGAAVAGLDLETDTHGTLLGWSSVTYDLALVQPGDPTSSLLVQKLHGAEGFGGAMPPSGMLAGPVLDEVEAWIAKGADDRCDGTTTPSGGSGEGYHPPTWPDPAEHGLAAKLQEDTCLACHGSDLSGGVVGIACADCHDAVTPDWTTTCTFCHGDPADGTGAPPEDIDDNTNPATISFPAHRVHLRSPLHADWDCTECHRKPVDVFSPGHLFVGDDTPGRADLDFSAGLAAGAQPTSAGCTNVYCHGADWSTGSVSRTATVECGDCHPVQSTSGRWDLLSDPHERHLDEGIRCQSCHPTVDAAGDLVDADRHVDGLRTVALPTGMTRANGRCTGTCHDETHNARAWVD